MQGKKNLSKTFCFFMLGSFSSHIRLASLSFLSGVDKYCAACFIYFGTDYGRGGLKVVCMYWSYLILGLLKLTLLTPAKCKRYSTESAKNSITPEFSVDEYYVAGFPYANKTVHIIGLGEYFFETDLYKEGKQIGKILSEKNAFHTYCLHHLANHSCVK